MTLTQHESETKPPVFDGPFEPMDELEYIEFQKYFIPIERDLYPVAKLLMSPDYLQEYQQQDAETHAARVQEEVRRLKDRQQRWRRLCQRKGIK